MGENQKQAFQLSFNRFLRVAFHGSRVTSDGGLILVRELDERLGFGKLIEQHLTDTRAKNTRLPLTDLLRQSVYSRLAGYEDVCTRRRETRPGTPRERRTLAEQKQTAGNLSQETVPGGAFRGIPEGCTQWSYMHAFGERFMLRGRANGR